MRRMLIVGGIFTACRAVFVLAQFLEVYRTGGRWSGIGLDPSVKVLVVAVIAMDCLPDLHLRCACGNQTDPIKA
ncbi:MAG TPA: hypothetical protein VNO32_02510 [Candidatus Acidoferrum sp.]|nr:hypothetical protein [Candidatus Acidoferrum sp.]